MPALGYGHKGRSCSAHTASDTLSAYCLLAYDMPWMSVRSVRLVGFRWIPMTRVRGGRSECLVAAEPLAAWLLQKLAIPGCPALAAAMLLPLLQLCAQVGVKCVVMAVCTN